MRESVLLVRAEDPAVAEERVRPRAEHPGREPEFRLRCMEHVALPVANALEVPPATTVAREDEIALGAPLGLPDRLAPVEAGDVLDVRERTLRRQICDVELATVPRHPRQVPGEEAEPRAVG